jgi:hypothetical protein
MATTTLLLHHHHHHEPHKSQAEEETSSCDGSDVSSRHPPSPPRPILPRGSHQNNDNIVLTCDDLRPPGSVDSKRLPQASCSDEDDCCSNNDDEDELLSVGSETPPPVMPITNSLIGFASPSADMGAGREEDDDSDAKTEIGSTSQSSDSCSRSSVSRCSLMTDGYSTSSSMTSPAPPGANPTKHIPSSPEHLLPGHGTLLTQHLHHSTTLRDGIFRRQIYRPQQHVSQLNHSSSVATAQNSNVSNNVSNNVSMRALKFSIDNILKPDFGRQTTPTYSIPKPKKGSSGGTLLSVRNPNSADVATGRISSSKRNGVAQSSHVKHGVSAVKVGSKGRSNGGALPMDLSKVVSAVATSADGRESSSASEGTVSAASPPAAAAGGAGTLPGSPQLLWPAWVYCTRYSDRPSSGKYSPPFPLKPTFHILDSVTSDSVVEFLHAN